MILNKVKVEQKDKITGMVVKRTSTTEEDFLNHKMAVNNSLFTYERQRLRFKKPLLNNPIQAHHIHFDKGKNMWDYDSLSQSKQHAVKQGRLFLTVHQRTREQWGELTFSEAEGNFMELASRGLSKVPYAIPMDATLEEWKLRRETAEEQLNKSQKLVPVFCSKHNEELFEDIFNYEFEKSQIIAVHCYTINEYDTMHNMAIIKGRTLRLQSGDEAPLLFGFGFERVQTGLSYVSGSFVYATFGFDILSRRQFNAEVMPTEAIKEMKEKGVEDMLKYDRGLGGFNKSAEQEFYEGVNLTQKFLDNVVLSEGLKPYQAVQWANHREQQVDFDILNKKLIETEYKYREESAMKYVNSKEKWNVFVRTMSRRGV